MPDILAGLCGLSIVLLFVTVIGHGIWVIVAWIFKKLLGDDPATQRPKNGTRCGACGNPYGVIHGRCVFCGSHASAPASQTQSELETIRRRLNQWHARGDLTAEQHRSLLQFLYADEKGTVPATQLKQLLTGAKAAQPAPTSVTEQLAPSPAVPADASKTRSQRVAPDILSPATPKISVHPLDEPVYLADVVESATGSSMPGAVPVRPPSPPAAPRRTLADMLQAFMEETNIRWAEIISGVLIVVSAVGLVISLRATLKERIPYFPALSFLLMTAAIHAAGLYTLKRWNLRRTSRGVLIIATLLVPLSFLASIILSGSGDQQRPATDPIFLIAVLVGLVSFATMNYFATRSLVRHGWWRLMTAVLGTSAGQLLINRMQPAASSALQATALLTIPVGAYLIANAWLLRQTARHTRMGTVPARQFFLELGICVFALGAPIGLFIAKSESIGGSLGNLSPLLSLVAATILASGLLAQRLMSGHKLATYRTASTTLAVLGGGLMLLMAAFAWPQLELLIAVGAVNFALLSAMAVVARLPLLHVPAIGCLGLSYLSAFHRWQGLVTDAPSPGARIFAATFTGRSGLALTILASGVAAAGCVLLRKKFREHGSYYLLAAGGLASLCIAIAGYAGFLAPSHAQGNLASPLFLYYSLAAFAVGWICVQANVRQIRWPWLDELPPMASVDYSISNLRARYQLSADYQLSVQFNCVIFAAALLLAAFVHALYVNTWLRPQLLSFGLLPERPILVAFLLHSSLLGLLSLFLVWQTRWAGGPSITTVSESEVARKESEFCVSVGLSALVSSVAALPGSLLLSQEKFGSHAVYVAACSVAWFCFSLLRHPPFSFAVFQSLATVSVIFAVAEGCSRTSWWSHELLSRTHLFVQCGVMAVCCAAWSAFRRQYRTQSVISSFWPASISVDKLVLVAVTFAIPVLALIACWTGIGLELGMAKGAASPTSSAASNVVSTLAPWCALAVALLALVVSLWERRSLVTLPLVVVATAAIPPLLAIRFEIDVAVASAMRWAFALFVAAWSVPAYYAFGRQPSAPWRERTRLISVGADALRVPSLFIGATAILLLTLAAFVSVAAGNQPGGPLASSIFTRVGSSISYATPLFILVAVFYGYALREAKAGYAMAASLTFQFALTLACLLPPLSRGAPIDQLTIAKLLQWNAVGLAVFGSVWTLSLRWIEPAEAARRPPAIGMDLLQVQIALLVVVQLCVAVWVAAVLFIDPVAAWPVCNVFGGATSYIGLIVSLFFCAWYLRSTKWAFSAHIILALLLVAVHVAAATAHAWDGSGRWWGHHTLSASRTVFAIGAAAWAVMLTFPTRRRLNRTSQSPDTSVAGAEGTDALALGGAGASRSASNLVRDVGLPSKLPVASRNTIQAAVIWSTAATVLAVLAAMRSAAADPLRPWWPAGITCTAMLVAAALSIRGRRQGFAYYSTVLAGIAALLTWIGLPTAHPLHDGVGLFSLHVIALSLAATVWLAVEVYYQRRTEPGLDRRSAMPASHRVVGVLFMAGLALFFTVMMVRVSLTNHPLRLAAAEFNSIVTAFITVSVLMVGSMWDRRARHSIFSVYLVTLGVAAFAADRISTDQPQRIVTLMAMLATQVAITGWMWSWGSKLATVGLRLGIPDPIDGLRRTVRWLPAAVLLLSSLLVGASFVVVLGTDHRPLRMTAACVPFFIAGGVAGLAQQHRRDAMQLIALLATGLGCILLGWADTPPDWTERTVLMRAIRLLMALCALAFAYGVVAVRVFSPTNGWRESARRVAVIFGGLAIVSLLGILGLEVATFQPGVGAPVDAIQIAAVSGVLVVLIIALISLAVLPGRDPMGFSERGRTAYVYAAQVVAGLLFAHIYLAIPELFSGRMRQYWPYIVVAIAFAGVGVSELFQRLQLPVLAEPFQRSGAFLAIIPAIGMWIVNSRSEYSLVLFVIGVLYMLLSFSQKSVLAGVIGAVAGNGALWSLLNGTEDLTFSKHPQFWLIPPAVSVLVASQLNRRRLTEAQLTAIRYIAVIVIYLSSAGEIFTIGIKESLWPPVILILLAIAGVIFGIAMQIRAYLYFGAIFILIAMVSMVAHASQRIQQTWPWWAFGIALGISIFILIGWFEGRRIQIMLLLNRLRQWEK